MSSEEVDSILDEYEIVEHEQAHAVAMAKTNTRERSLLVEEEEESRWGRTAGPQGNLAEPFLDSFSGMISRSNLQSILKEQNQM